MTAPTTLLVLAPGPEEGLVWRAACSEAWRGPVVVPDHPTLPTVLDFLPEVDSVVVGVGEHAWPALVLALAGRVAGAVLAGARGLGWVDAEAAWAEQRTALRAADAAGRLGPLPFVVSRTVVERARAVIDVPVLDVASRDPVEVAARVAAWAQTISE